MIITVYVCMYICTHTYGQGLVSLGGVASRISSASFLKSSYTNALSIPVFYELMNM